MPFYPSLPQAQPANLVGSALAGYGAVQDVQKSQAANALGQIQLGKAQRGESALSDFGKTGDMEAYTMADPKAALEMQEAFSKMDERQQKVLIDRVKVFDSFKGTAVNNPETYQPMLDGLGPEFAKFFPDAEKFKAMSPAERQEVMFSKEKMAATIKQGMTEYQKVKAQNDALKTQAYVNRQGALTDQGAARVGQGAERVALDRERTGKTGGGWFVSPDGSQRNYYTPNHPPPAGWAMEKGSGKGTKEDKETVFTPKNPNNRREGYTKTERYIPRGSVASPAKQPEASPDGTPIGKTPDGRTVYEGPDGNRFTTE